MYNNYRRPYPSKFQRSPFSSVVFIFLAIIIVIFGLVFSKKAQADPGDIYWSDFNSFSIGNISGQDSWQHSASKQDCVISSDGLDESNAIRMQQTGASSTVMCYRNGTAHEAGTISFWFSGNNPGTGVFVRNSGSSYNQLQFGIGNGRIYYNFATGTAVYYPFSGILDYEWNRLQVDWDCSTEEAYITLNGVIADGGNPVPMNALCDTGNPNQIWFEMNYTDNTEFIIIDELNTFGSYYDESYYDSINWASAECETDLVDYFSMGNQLCFDDRTCRLYYSYKTNLIDYDRDNTLYLFEPGVEPDPYVNTPYATSSLSNDYNPYIIGATENADNATSSEWSIIAEIYPKNCPLKVYEREDFTVTYLPVRDLSISACDDPCSDLATSTDWYSFDFTYGFNCGFRHAYCWLFDIDEEAERQFSEAMYKVTDNAVISTMITIYDFSRLLTLSTTTPAGIDLLWFDDEGNVTSTGATLLSADIFEDTGMESLHSLIYNILQILIYGLLVIYFIKRLFPRLQNTMSSADIGISRREVKRNKALLIRDQQIAKYSKLKYKQ